MQFSNTDGRLSQGCTLYSEAMGIFDGGKGNCQAATHYLLNALSLFEELCHLEYMSASLASLGIILSVQQDHAFALKRYCQAQSINIQLENWSSVAKVSNNIGYSLAALGDLVEAERAYNKALTIFHALGDQKGMETTQYNLSLLSPSLEV